MKDRWAAIGLATVTTDDSQDLFSRGSILVGLIFVFYPGGKEKGLADFINTLRGEGVRNKTQLRALMTLFIDFWDAASVPSKCEVSLKEQNSNGNTGFCQKETTKIFGLCAKAKPSQKCQTTKEEQHVFSCSHFLHNFLSILFIIRFCHQTFTFTNSLKTLNEWLQKRNNPGQFAPFPIKMDKFPIFGPP